MCVSPMEDVFYLEPLFVAEADGVVEVGREGRDAVEAVALVEDDGCVLVNAGFEAEEARRFFGEPSFPVFEFEPFEKLIRPWPTREAYDRFVEVVEQLTAELPN